MNKRLLTLLILAVFSCAVLYHSFSTTSSFAYPGSHLILKKYYPENEILGMAFDKKWREVRVSNDMPEVISHWYEKTMANHLLSENSADVYCSKKSWRDGEEIKLRIIICNHGDYRTILTVFDQQ